MRCRDTARQYGVDAGLVRLPLLPSPAGRAVLRRLFDRVLLSRSPRRTRPPRSPPARRCVRAPPAAGSKSAPCVPAAPDRSPASSQPGRPNPPRMLGAMRGSRQRADQTTGSSGRPRGGSDSDKSTPWAARPGDQPSRSPSDAAAGASSGVMSSTTDGRLVTERGATSIADGVVEKRRSPGSPPGGLPAFTPREPAGHAPSVRSAR